MRRPAIGSFGAAVVSICLLVFFFGSPAGRAQPAAPDGRYVIEFHQYGPAAAALVRQAGGAPVHEFPQYRAIAARLPAPALQALRAHPDVMRVEEDARRYPLAQTMPYGIPLVQADQVAAGDGLAGCKVCIIDSGYRLWHEDLPVDAVTGENDSRAGDWSVDGCGHGTHVAGTIAALHNDVGVVGVVPGGAALHIVRVFGDSCAWAYSSDLVAALGKCRDAGALVVNMSLGGTFASSFEQQAFADAYEAGVLPIAAAGNGGNSGATYYPAGYASVVSVAAVDHQKTVAYFSQRNESVELAAPGVSVLSTVPWTNANTVAAGGTMYWGNWIENAARSAGVSGTLANGGRCASPGSWNGSVVLCERGDITFYEKVMNVEAGGGVAAVVYNNAPGNFNGTLGFGNSSAIPAISLAQDEGQSLVATALGLSGEVVSHYDPATPGYGLASGTSMATPHVAGVAALVWSHDLSWTNAQIRAALQASAEDLGAPGRDTSYGFGLVRAKAALDALTGSSPPPPVQDTVSLTAVGYKFRGKNQVDLTWTGATTSQVGIYRNGAWLGWTANTGAYTDVISEKRGTYTYVVCTTSDICSNQQTVTFK